MGGVGEDVVVDVGVFQGGVGILPETVEEENNTEEDGSGEDVAGRREENGGHDR